MNTEKKKVIALLEQTPGDLKSAELHILRQNSNINTLELVIKKRVKEYEKIARENSNLKNEKQRKEEINKMLRLDPEYQDFFKELRRVKSDLQVYEIEYKYKKRMMLNQRAICYLIGDEE